MENDFMPDVDDYDYNKPWSDSDDEEREKPYGYYLDDLVEEFDLLSAPLVARSNLNKKDPEVWLQDGVWGSLPKEVLWSILMRLPVASQCRFRCVCKGWKTMLSPPSSAAGQHRSPLESRPLCTILSETGTSQSLFFSHAEKKWYRLLFRPESCLHIDWTLRATDGALLCYDRRIVGKLWLLVCNQINESFQVVPPNYSSRDGTFRVAKFAVDKEANSFRIILMHLKAITIFESKTQDWKLFEMEALTAPGESELVWKNMIYIPAQQPGVCLTLDMVSGLWDKMKVNIPRAADQRYHFANSKDQVMLMQLDRMGKHPIRIWILLDPKDGCRLSLSNWREVAIDIPSYMTPVLSQMQIIWSYGHEVIFLATCWTNHWISYTFKTNTWNAMLCDGRHIPLPDGHGPGMFKWRNWEPCIDFYVELKDFDADQYPELAAYQKERQNAVLQTR